MQVFEKSSDSGWGNRLNVIDENNVFVGFDFESSCCENFGYVFTDKKPVSEVDFSDQKSVEFKHEDFVFDPEYFEKLTGSWLNEGGAVSFRLINKQGSEIFLVLYNCHNGYYGHGFEMKVGDSTKYDDSL
jgi:hypothetical protein